MLATDGVAADFSVSLASGVAAQELAERVLEQHGKGTDDALAAVVRYLGPPARVAAPRADAAPRARRSPYPGAAPGRTRGRWVPRWERRRPLGHCLA